ncbi:MULTISPECIES: LacI family DNA-binding transcriptional regulator [unclassified Mesorhizobium]|uniref:LacI family DNA-binding transcriptional regulator n=1 Tax=unclassified Mesorhizobium TaxID=325217 RepID=UPI000BAFB7F4|nr:MULTISPECIES: LacI family DNA-binding transcriptional regulator [unclassified Mesorhizobium]TGT56579.1 LacI family DNA-binding transcriptional regulator [Mesorhizobium sp. M00.F.Ca.ET.170.01.1.1]AZO11639.1 LacI family DNA-binding transcriptional regulator [Mesorhizobium sp. M3A.F.Ca.ET.080.04.2.1]PBB86742.1 LacI family transcriptional regulator [Mesorhizobium sp. WSM3876]RWB72726.1 MAG: LacI family DNA-binding transcriptional regulator [Mesorhizobium sp.]RWB87001.1 MAG: LacI family DNA-bind
MASRAKATILDIAREAGVSKSTVSLVLQGSGLIRPETATRVRKAIEDVGYVYNRGAANLRKAHSNVIGMVINDLTNPFFAELAVGMERVFQAAGIVPFIANTAENPVRQEEVLKSLMEQGVAGLIVSPARGTTPGAFRRIETAGVPIVFAMRRLPESRIPVIAPDNHRGAFLATEHLIRKGHRRLAFFGGSSDLVVYHERLGGFLEACDALGIAERTIVEGETSRKGGMACLETALAASEPPTAALCFNDAVAFGVMLALRKRGLEAGTDFAVVGFDDVVEAEHYMPALTSVAVNTAGLGERAAHAMLKMIQSRTTRAEDHIGAISLVVRESCGPDRNTQRIGTGDPA